MFVATASNMDPGDPSGATEACRRQAASGTKHSAPTEPKVPAQTLPFAFLLLTLRGSDRPLTQAVLIRPLHALRLPCGLCV